MYPGMSWIVWVLAGAVALRAAVGLLLLWDRRTGAAPAVRAARRAPETAG